MANQMPRQIVIRATRQHADAARPCLHGLVASLDGQLDTLEPDLWVITCQGDYGNAAETLGVLFDSGLVSFLGFGEAG